MHISKSKAIKLAVLVVSVIIEMKFAPAVVFHTAISQMLQEVAK